MSAGCDVSGQVPEEWARIGFSGLFAVVCDVDKPPDPAKMPHFLGGSGDRAMVLRYDEHPPDGGPPGVIVVYKDAVGLMAAMTAGGERGE